MADKKNALLEEGNQIEQKKNFISGFAWKHKQSWAICASVSTSVRLVVGLSVQLRAEHSLAEAQVFST